MRGSHSARNGKDRELRHALLLAHETCSADAMWRVLELALSTLAASLSMEDFVEAMSEVKSPTDRRYPVPAPCMPQSD